MTIQIYDANAYLRRSLNRHECFDPAGADPRITYQAALQSQIPQIWVWDGPNNNDRRREIFPGYKIRDYTGQENIFAGLQIYRDVLVHSRAHQIEVPGWEADDVCATVARHYANAGMPVVVHTNDFDFHQLTVHPLIKIKGVKPHENVPAIYVPLYKACRGDSSDKIDGIPGFGPKTWASMRDLWPVMDKALAEKDADTFRSLPFTKKPTLWLSSDENFELLCGYYAITRMFDVPMDLIEKHTKVGQPNPAAANQLFSRFML